MSKDKILIVAFNDLGIGGIQNVIMNIVRHLSSDFTFDIVCFDNDRTDFEEEFKIFGGSIFYVKSGSLKQGLRKKIEFYLGDNKLYREIKKIIKLHGPYAAVHSHKDLLSGPVLKAAKECLVPVRIAHAHTNFNKNYNKIARYVADKNLKLILKNATDMVGCSLSAAESLFGKNADYKVIYNPVDDRYLNADIKPTKSPAPHLLQVGMICDNKNQAFSLDVFYEIKKELSNATLTFIGAPKDSVMQKYLDELKAKTKELGIDNSVRFYDSADLYEEYSKADYLLFPSKAEGLGIVPIEAQAMGLYCFVSDSVPHDIDCGGCAFLKLSSGAELWAERIAEQFKTDNGKREKFDVSRFSPDIIMAQYRKLYKGE